ncbi:hypothetical protein [Paraburkholderia fungorum]|jgi:hypothetical protein|uniref:Uncharacterized protein n=1 Tax=Paraburkholderia fungorum TaxID=134537 RepID=A0AAP5QHB5_9BURK|nr:hypothetical protein [Paraburkholderia fungorum]MDT8843683.1 hypothetical protein [Paraburkholderia fungorum]PZR45654.1 MAG: hypothetical protein DI523_20210 [Paraburkholderia fungorum]
MSDAIAWWGAALSTVLAFIKLWELWRDRFQLQVGYNFRSIEDPGNEVIIRNLSTRPIVLTYWELLYCAGRFPSRTFEPFRDPGADAEDLQIAPHTSHTLTFAEQDHFNWGVTALNGRAIYVRLHVAGRRPILRKVYSH